MSLLPYVALCLAAAAVSLLALRRSGSTGWLIATALLATAAIVAVFVAPGPAVVGGAPTEVDGYLRLVAALGCAFGVGLTLVAATLDAGRHGGGRDAFPIAAVPLACAAALGLGAVALAMAPDEAAMPAALVGIAGLLGLAAMPRDESNVTVGRSILRVVAIAGALVIVGAAVVLGTAHPLAAEPVSVGGAALLLAGGVALRIGAIPFHATVARLLPRAGLAAPFVLVWAAIPLVVSAIAVMTTGVSSLDLPLAAERGLIALVALVTLLVAPVVAAVTDDLDHVVAYSIVADMGMLLLAFAAETPAWEPIRTWLLVVATSKTALIAWSVAMRDAYGSVRLSDLHGWAIRAPGLAGALALVGLATLGVPTFASAAVRRDIADGVFSEPLASAAFAASLLAVLPYLRLAAVGLSTPSPVVRRAPDERLRRPAAWLLRARNAVQVVARPPVREPEPGSGRGLADSLRQQRDPDAERAAARVADIARKFAIGAGRGDLPTGPRSLADQDRERAGRADGDDRRPRVPRTPRTPMRQRLRQAGAELHEAWQLNLVPIAAGLVLAIAALSFAVSVGWFDLRGAAAEREPAPIATPAPSTSPAP